MPTMTTRLQSEPIANNNTYGLPRFSYRPPIIATTLAALFLFALLLALAVLGSLNTITQVGRIAAKEPGASTFGAGFCGLLSLVMFAGALYFLNAIFKGIRDFGGKPYYTRGTVIVRKDMQSRKASNWLMVDPEYAGTDVHRATVISDEQRAASVDRAEIFQPRFTPRPFRRGPRPGSEELKREIDTLPEVGSGYLTPGRISAAAETDPGAAGDPSIPHAVFRIDFASRVGIAAGEETLVAHSRYLQHVYYVARLRNGEWEVHRNKSLI